MSEPSQDRVGYWLILLICLLVAAVIIGGVFLVAVWLAHHPVVRSVLL